MNSPTPNSIRRQLDQTRGFTERQQLLKQLWQLERRQMGERENVSRPEKNGRNERRLRSA